MARKHLIKYYNDVCKQYFDFIEEIKDFEQCATDGVIAPEVIDNIESMLAPLKNNWQTMNYVIYLLNMPNKKEKTKNYTKQNKCENCKTDKEVFIENDACINAMKKLNNTYRKNK